MIDMAFLSHFPRLHSDLWPHIPDTRLPFKGVRISPPLECIRSEFTRPVGRTSLSILSPGCEATVRELVQLEIVLAQPDGSAICWNFDLDFHINIGAVCSPNVRFQELVQPSVRWQASLDVGTVRGSCPIGELECPSSLSLGTMANQPSL